MLSPVVNKFINDRGNVAGEIVGENVYSYVRGNGLVSYNDETNIGLYIINLHGDVSQIIAYFKDKKKKKNMIVDSKRKKEVSEQLFLERMMMKMIKKYILLFYILCVVPITSYANEVMFRYDEITQSIVGIVDESDSDTLVFPAKFNGNAVKNISCFTNKKYASIIFEEGIERLEGCPFADNYIFPQSLTKMSYLYCSDIFKFPDVLDFKTADENGVLYVDKNIKIIPEADYNWEVDFYLEEDKRIYIFADCYITKYKVDEANPYFTEVDGVLFTKDRKILVSYPFAETREEYIVPAETENICAHAFSNCIYLRKITLHENIKFVGEDFGAICNPEKTWRFSNDNLFNRDLAITLDGKKLDVDVFLFNGTTYIETEDFYSVGFNKFKQKFDYIISVGDKKYIPLKEVLVEPISNDEDNNETARKYYNVKWNNNKRTVEIIAVGEKL